jgi:3-carboxy-cis,cis-muconate cycloisomerase
MAMSEQPSPFLPLLGVFGDPEMGAVFSESARVERWLHVERALAQIQGELGVIPSRAATAIMNEALSEKVDLERLRRDTRSVGYPIVSLVGQIAAHSSPDVGQYMHWGATTQDIMDTGLVLQLQTARLLIQTQVEQVADQLAGLAREHRITVIAGRTHGQQAVPTTLGAKLAVLIEEFSRHLDRLAAAGERVEVISLFGAAGTAAALGGQSREARRRLAAQLNIGMAETPGHSARDGLAELGFVLAAISATCGKLAGEVIALSRTEIGEVREGGARDHGASSTMPQKSNPSLSEAIVGMSAMAIHGCPALLHAMQGTHERSAGEWQIEWDSLPSLFCLTAGCLRCTGTVLANLEVRPERMRTNLTSDGGSVMAEAVMMAAAVQLGRLEAHELVGQACRIARETDRPLIEVLRETLDGDVLSALPPLNTLVDPDAYLGEAPEIVDSVLGRWERRPRRSEEQPGGGK